MVATVEARSARHTTKQLLQNEGSGPGTRNLAEHPDLWPWTVACVTGSAGLLQALSENLCCHDHAHTTARRAVSCSTLTPAQRTRRSTLFGARSALLAAQAAKQARWARPLQRAKRVRCSVQSARHRSMPARMRLVPLEDGRPVIGLPEPKQLGPRRAPAEGGSKAAYVEPDGATRSATATCLTGAGPLRWAPGARPPARRASLRALHALLCRALPVYGHALLRGSGQLRAPRRVWFGGAGAPMVLRKGGSLRLQVGNEVDLNPAQAPTAPRSSLTYQLSVDLTDDPRRRVLDAHQRAPVAPQRGDGDALLAAARALAAKAGAANVAAAGAHASVLVGREGAPDAQSAAAPEADSKRATQPECEHACPAGGARASCEDVTRCMRASAARAECGAGPAATNAIRVASKLLAAAEAARAHSAGQATTQQDASARAERKRRAPAGPDGGPSDSAGANG